MVSLAELVSETEGSVGGVASTEDEETKRFLNCVVMAVSWCRDDEEEGDALLL